MKQEIRARINALRKGLSKEEAAEKSQLIIKKLLTLPELQDASVVIAYDSIGNEVSTQELNTVLSSKELSGIPVERVQDTITIETLHTKEETDLHINIPDAVIIPGVAFDQAKNRLGRGRGFYDRLLERMNVKKIALAYEFQIVDHIPTEPHDVGMDIIVTETRVIR